MPWDRLDEDERIGAPVLIREIGVWRAMKAGRRVRRALRAGEPFAHLPPPANDAEQKSRAQIGRAIVLYRVLLRYMDAPRAKDVTEAVVVEAACHFLRQQLGSLSQETISAVPESERVAWIQAKGAKFFNATTTWDHISERAVDFTVTACVFPTLCKQAGVPELAPIFCAGDAKYFGTVEPNVTLDRPHTIAGGASTCAFHLRYGAGPRS